MEKDIVLIKAEDKKRFFMPFGLLYVASALKKGGFRPWIFHVHHKEVKKVLGKIKEIDPILVGFSTLTGGSLLPTLRLSEMVKVAGYHVMWGGVHSTFLPELCLEERFVDFVVRGEGEETALELANHLKDGDENLEGVRGLAYRENGKIRINPERDFIVDLDQYEIPWELIDVERYISAQFGRKRVFPLITSRGCPFRCGFCYNLAFNKRRWRAHSSGFMENQVTFLKEKFNIEGVLFYDDNLFAGKKRSKKIIDNMKLPWFNELRADILDEEFVEWLKKSLCQRIFIGAESGSQRILDSIKKDLSLKQVEEAVSLLSMAGIDAELSFIVGIPGETEEDRRKTYDFIDKLQVIHPHSTASVKLYAPYPGTPLWDESLNYGFSVPKDNLDWAKLSHERCSLPWLDTRKAETVFLVAQYALSNIEDTFPKGRRLIAPLERVRWKKRFFDFPLEVEIIKWGKRVLSGMA